MCILRLHKATNVKSARPYSSVPWTVLTVPHNVCSTPDSSDGFEPAPDHLLQFNLHWILDFHRFLTIQRAVSEHWELWACANSRVVVVSIILGRAFIHSVWGALKWNDSCVLQICQTGAHKVPIACVWASLFIYYPGSSETIIISHRLIVNINSRKKVCFMFYTQPLRNTSIHFFQLRLHPIFPTAVTNHPLLCLLCVNAYA